MQTDETDVSQPLLKLIRRLSNTAQKVFPRHPSLITPKDHGILVTPFRFNGLLTNECRSNEKLERVFVDLSGKKALKSKGGNQYAMIFRDDKTRMSWEYFLRSIAETSDKLEQWLTDIRLYGISDIIRSDDASELKGGKSIRSAGNTASSKSLRRRIGRS